MNEYIADYLIVGAGVAGSSLAYELAKKSSKVTVLDKGVFTNSGASSVPLALANPHRGRSARANPSDRECIENFWLTVKEIEAQNIKTGVYAPGVLRIASNAKQMKNWHKVSKAKALSSEEIKAPYHAPWGGILVEQGAYMEPRVYLKSLLKAAKTVKLIENTEVLAVQRIDKINIVITENAEFKAKMVIFCTGPESQERFNLPKTEPVAGELIALNSDLKMPYPIAGAVYGMSINGQIQIGGNHRHDGRQDPDADKKLRKSFSWFIKELHDAQIADVWTGVRAKAADNKPFFKDLSDNQYFFGGLGGRGFLCASKLAKHLAKII